jgi:HEAT repeat protein
VPASAPISRCFRTGVPLALAALGTACAPPRDDAGFDSPLPSARIASIQDAGRTRDDASVERLIEQLDASDPAVRLAAIEALFRITGETLGYRADDPPAERAAAVDRWVAHVGRTDQEQTDG